MITVGRLIEGVSCWAVALMVVSNRLTGEFEAVAPFRVATEWCDAVWLLFKHGVLLMKSATLMLLLLSLTSIAAKASVCTLAAVPELMHVGDVLPPLIYKISGAGCEASSFTGKPVIATTATNASSAGNYPITVSAGTMASLGNSLAFEASSMAVIPVDPYGAVISTRPVQFPSNFLSGAAFPAVDAAAFMANDCSSDVTSKLNDLLTKSGARTSRTGNYFRKPMYIWMRGCYLVSGPLNVYGNVFILQGAGPGNTTIRVMPNSPAFNTGADANLFNVAPSTGQNEGFQEFIEDLDIDVGYGNPNLIGIRWTANNVGAVRNVRIWSEDQAAHFGIAFNAAYPGPSFFKNVAIYGFIDCMYRQENEYIDTADQITCEGQSRYGINIKVGIMALQHLLIYDAGSAINIDDSSAQNETVLDSELIQVRGSSPAPGIYHGINSRLYARNVIGTGYTATIVDRGTGQTAKYVGVTKEAWTGPAHTLFNARSAPSSLNLPFPEEPAAVDPPVASWCSLSSTDPSTWQSAMNACASSTVYIPPSVTTVAPKTSYTVTVPLKINHVQCYGNIISPPTSFVIFNVVGSATDAPLIFDKCMLDYSYNLSGSRTVAINDGYMASSSVVSTGTNTVFIEDTQFPANQTIGPGQHFYGRQLDIETALNKATCVGCTFIALGYKSERIGPQLTLTSGGRAEILGWYQYPVGCAVTPSNPPRNTAVATNVSLSANGGIVTATFAPIARPYDPGQFVSIKGASPKGFDGIYHPLTNPAPTTTSFSYEASLVAGNASGSITVTGTQCPNVGSTNFDVQDSAIFENGYMFVPSGGTGVQYLVTETKNGVRLTMPATDYVTTQVENMYYSLPSEPR